MGGAEGDVPGDLLLFINEDQLGQTERYTILWLLHKTTHERRRLYTKHTSTHTAAGQAAVENICRGQDAHMSVSLYAVFAFLQRIYISRKTYSFTRPPDAEH